MSQRSLDSIVDVVVQVSPIAAARPTFDQALIIGEAGIIPETERLRLYENTADILTDGFADTDPEYIAALLYFSQNPAPDKLWLGMRNDSVSGIDGISIAAAGSGYHLGDTLTIVQGAVVSGKALVTGIGSSGEVTAVSLSVRGTGYTTGVGLVTTVSPAGGTGCTITITAVGAESRLEALQACRLASYDWWACMACDAAKADHTAIAAWIETAEPFSFYFGTTQDPDVITGATDDVCGTLKAANYTRCLIQYSTSSAYASAAIMGYAMGQNTGLINSAYTLKFKQEVGVTTEALTATQINYAEAKYCNLYLSYAGDYEIFEQGRVPSGQFFDEILNLDMLASNIQLNVMDLLYQSPKIPQTDAGQTQIIRCCNDACDEAVKIGFLAPGQWTGVDILNLKTDDILPNGYLCQSEPYSEQSSADRELRKGMPVYIAIKEAGAVHSVVIGVYVNR